MLLVRKPQFFSHEQTMTHEPTNYYILMDLKEIVSLISSSIILCRFHTSLHIYYNVRMSAANDIIITSQLGKIFFFFDFTQRLIMQLISFIFLSCRNTYFYVPNGPIL
jgi:hypothetical protein